MGKTIRDHLVNTLDDLLERDFKRFKAKLNDLSQKSGYKNIPRGTLEKAENSPDVADLLVRFYREDDALEVAKLVLMKIDHKQLYKRLSQATGTAADPKNEVDSSPIKGKRRSDAKPFAVSILFDRRLILVCILGSVFMACIFIRVVPDSQEVHFVDKYKTQIIQRLTDPDAILDQLHAQKFLRDEAYEWIHAKPTSQEKLRELYLVSRAWGNKGKDEFYRALEKEHPHLVQDLKGQ